MSNRLLGRTKVLGCACAVAALSLTVTSPASAQIYSWRDSDGRLTLSNRPRDTSAPSHLYPVPKTTAIRTTSGFTGVRSELYDGLLVEHARRNNVRADLVRAVVQVESGYNPYAQSPKGALGLMQLMPATIHDFAVHNPFDPADNVRAGVAYLKQLLDRYQNNEELALAAYNAGPGAVDKYGQNVPPYPETKHYVAQIDQLTKRPLDKRDNHIYKVIEIIDGHPIARYTDKKPTSGEYVVVSR